MKIYHSIDDFQRLHCAVVTSGTFDGVHLGHQTILNRLKEVADKSKGETVVITFWPHPRLILNAEDDTLKLLNTFEEKAALLKEQGIQHLLRITFTKEFSQLTSHDFITNILVDKIGTRKLVIGYDHRFGRNREGSFEELKLNAVHYGFDVEEIPRQDVDHVAVSSTKIRQALEEGDIGTASQLLGKPYSISGRVVKGDKIGRELGYPTANIDIDSNHKLIPNEGIYAVTVEYEHQLINGMLYIGNRPTINGNLKRSIEVNLFDFNKDIYGETLKINLIAYLRGDIKFNGLDALKEQLHKDKQSAINALKNS
ncbi:MAG: riboflavin biosynthesis protein RibF [Azospira oryzae]|jgi:riboflavin kinase/FMN adenylyltransferase|nr:riboflavin biosynthesis protein RibF [Cytophaga sp.]PZR34052.1 MAG: riboflavin biosynthesis protein RibF [Azospira oryzae]